MVTITQEAALEVPAREALLDRAFGKSRRRKTSEKLRGIVQLVDARHPPTPDDLRMLDFLAGIELPTLVALTKVDKLIVGGGIANTFLAAAGHNVGKSLVETEMLDIAKGLLKRSAELKAEIPLPTDVVVAKEFSANAEADVKKVSDVAADDMILDIGPDTAESFSRMCADAGTIVWNGPVGVFEFDQFGEGTRALAQAVARSSAFSIAGGGDTLAAIEKYRVEDDISYISTGGGAFLEFLEGKKLPAVAVLEERGQ